MKKIPTIFKRNPKMMSEILPDVTPECQWVFNGEGISTRKYDDTCCMINENGFWKRREVKKGKTDPADFMLEQEDKNTGKRVGWVPVDFEDKANKYHVEAYLNLPDRQFGTYELCGPKIQGDHEKFGRHILKKHSEAEVFLYAPRSYDGLQHWLKDKDIEGLVFHHPDGRMAKIKKRDFGLDRKQ